MQLLWRAEKITIPEIRISDDFQYWGSDDIILKCPFLKEVTHEEISVMKQFLMDDNFSDTTRWFMHSWQDYEKFIKKDKEDDMEFMPEWYEFYDGLRGTGSFLLLPDVRGKKEEFYINIYREWKQKQPAEERKVSTESAVPPQLFVSKQNFSDFMRKFENNYLNQLHDINSKEATYPDKYYSRHAVWDAIAELETTETPIYLDAGMNWHEALIKAARQHKNKRIIKLLDDVYDNYLMDRQLRELKIANIDEIKNR